MESLCCDDLRRINAQRQPFERGAVLRGGLCGFVGVNLLQDADETAEIPQTFLREEKQAEPAAPG